MSDPASTISAYDSLPFTVEPLPASFGAGLRAWNSPGWTTPSLRTSTACGSTTHCCSFPINI